MQAISPTTILHYYFLEKELTPEYEYRFHPTRRWRFDIAFPDWKIAIEIEGITPNVGRHQRMGGYEKDCEKYNAAQLLGWIVLRYSPRQIRKELDAVREELEMAIHIRSQ